MNSYVHEFSGTRPCYSCFPFHSGILRFLCTSIITPVFSFCFIGLPTDVSARVKKQHRFRVIYGVDLLSTVSKLSIRSDTDRFTMYFFSQSTSNPKPSGILCYYTIIRTMHRRFKCLLNRK